MCLCWYCGVAIGDDGVTPASYDVVIFVAMVVVSIVDIGVIIIVGVIFQCVWLFVVYATVGVLSAVLLTAVLLVCACLWCCRRGDNVGVGGDDSVDVVRVAIGCCVGCYRGYGVDAYDDDVYIYIFMLLSMVRSCIVLFAIMSGLGVRTYIRSSTDNVGVVLCVDGVIVGDMSTLISDT